MATVRSGSKGVLMVVDVQVGVMQAAWQSARVIGNVARVVAKARAQGVPVLWVQHGDRQLVVGSPPWQWVPELVPAPGDPLVHKQFNSAFEQTGLEPILAGLGATHITLAGASTNWCIRATAYAALERGYDVTLVADAHTTEPLEPGDGSHVAPASLIQDLNMAMAWLEYPGRRNSTTTAEAASFAAPAAA